MNFQKRVLDSIDKAQNLEDGESIQLTISKQFHPSTTVDFTAPN